jgi:hypothetical protein
VELGVGGADVRRWNDLTPTEKEAWRRWVFETSIQFGASYECAGKVSDLFYDGLEQDSRSQPCPAVE